eukprot:m.122844 g.122844  ORF g.122844 m.122844 type:complete len:60 (-) comp9397_c1_seq7:89-268(-)
MRGGESIIKGNPCNRGLQIGGMCGLEEYSINTQKVSTEKAQLKNEMHSNILTLIFCSSA